MNSSSPSPVRGHLPPPRHATDRPCAQRPAEGECTEPVVRPTFSVCIVVRDRPELLVDAVRSVLANTFRDFEIVVVDDGSRVPVRQVLDQAQVLADGRVRVATQPPTGIAEARNLGLRTVRGRYLTVLDSDDQLTPDALERLHRLLSTTDGTWVYADYTEVTRGSSRLIRLPEYASARSMLVGVLTRPRLPFKHSGTTVDRVLLDRLGGYDESFRLFEDVELMLRALAAGVLPRHLDHPIVLFHRHDGNVTRGRMGGLVYWFRLIDMYRPVRMPGAALAIKALRTMSETGKWLVTLGR